MIEDNKEELAESRILASFLQILLKKKNKKEAMEAFLHEILSIDWLPIKPKAGIFLVSTENNAQLKLYITSPNFSPELLVLCDEVDFGHCVCGRAASTKKIIFVSCVDEQHERRFPGMEPHGHYCVPFFDSKGEIVGVLALYVEHAHTSKKSEFQFLELISSSLGAICDRFDFEAKYLKQKTEWLRQKESLDIAALVSETDLNGIITYVNDRFCEVSKYLSSELIGMPHNIINSGVHSKEYWEDFWTTIKSGQIWKGEICNKAKDGELYWVESSVLPILDENKKMIGFSAIRLDISEKKELEEKEKQALEIKSRFLANMSHEIRTPMNGILGMVTLLGDTSMSPDQSEMLKSISSCGEDLMTILNDVLDLSKNESGELGLEIIPFNLLDCINDVIYISTYRASQKNIKISLFIDDNLPEVLHGDPTRIKQIMVNYLSNAIKFSSIDGKVIIRIEGNKLDEGLYTIKFSVKDFGIGISKENQGKLFKPFIQADVSTTREFGGTGLGLAIVASIVKVMKGTFNLESEEGAGSVFSFSVDLKKGNGYKTIGNSNEISADYKLNKFNHNVLIVEDNPVNQKLVSLMVNKLGHSFDLASNGKEALDKIKDNSYSIILMDIQMPIINGIDATTEIIRLYGSKRPCIVAITANAFKEDRDACFNAGMDDFISKPVKLSEITRVFFKFARLVR